MARKSDRALVEELTATWEPRLRAAFLASIRDVTDNVTLRVVVERLERGDVPGAVEAMRLRHAHLASFTALAIEVYRAAGAVSVASVGGSDPFDPFEPTSESQIRDHLESFTARVQQDAEDGLTAYLVSGLASGVSAGALALAVLGVRQRRNQRRFGGLLGLTALQIQAVTAASKELSSGQYGAYLSREGREKKLDRLVRTMMQEERDLGASDLRRVLRSYADRLLRLRARVVGTTEAGIAVAVGRHEGARQAYRAAGIGAATKAKTWISRRDDRVRETHVILDNQKVPVDGLFTSPSGAVLRYPRDPEAPPEEIINCRCFLTYAPIAQGEKFRRERADFEQRFRLRRAYLEAASR